MRFTWLNVATFRSSTTQILGTYNLRLRFVFQSSQVKAPYKGASWVIAMHLSIVDAVEDASCAE